MKGLQVAVEAIDIFPTDIQEYMLECNNTLDSSIDYMGCSMLWLLSVIVGNSIQIEVKKGWYEVCNVWIAIVGKAGLGKTPSINNIIYPLQKINSKRIKEYIKQYDKYEEYSKLSAEEQKQKEHDVAQGRSSHLCMEPSISSYCHR